MVKEPEFHPSSQAVLQRLVSVIVTMGLILVSRMRFRTFRFQHFSDDWLCRVMRALKNWQFWATKHSPPFSLWNPSANQLGEYLIDVDKRGPTVARSIWAQLDWVRRELGGACPTDSSLLASFRLHAVGHLPTPADEMPPVVFLAIMHHSSNTQGAVAMCKAKEVLSSGECHEKSVCVSRFLTEFLLCCRRSTSRTLISTLSSLNLKLPRPMTYGKFLRTLRSFHELIGVPRQVAQCVKYNFIRREARANHPTSSNMQETN